MNFETRQRCATYPPSK